MNATGADAGRVLRGASPNNHGLRVLVSEAQPRGKDGAITGGIVILHAGDNKHARSLAALLHRPTDAEEVLGVIRRHHAGCVHVLNTNILVLEPGAAAGREPGPVSEPPQRSARPLAGRGPSPTRISEGRRQGPYPFPGGRSTRGKPPFSKR